MERGDSPAMDAGRLDANAGDASQGDERIRGAVYFPASAYNVDQMWMEYDPAVIERDLGYAARIHLNALRVFGSYHAYQQGKASYESHVEHLLEQASARSMRVLFVVYEGAGTSNVDATLRALKDPLRAVAVQSPALALTADASKWQPLRDHIAWFMRRFKDDARLLAIEVINEPSTMTAAFTREMLRVAIESKGRIPITVGTLGEEIADYLTDGVDVLQFHNNFPLDVEASQMLIKQRLAQARSLGLPMWMTTWQRPRPSGPNWRGDYASPASERYPDFAPLAEQVNGYGAELGSFFWGLMVKPGYLAGQRNAGTVTGLFWEDGAVWDLTAARLIADDPGLHLSERKRIPFELLRFRHSESGRDVQCTKVTDGTGEGRNVLASGSKGTADDAVWQLVRLDGEEYVRLESVSCQRWLQCTTAADATAGMPDATGDADALAVNAVDKSNTGDQTRWRWVESGDGDYRFALQNKATGHYLQVSALADVDGGAVDGLQLRAVPSIKADGSTSFRSVYASQ